METKTITKIIGWYGVLALLGAYALLSFNLLSADNIWYQILNVTGALGIVINALWQKDYPPAVLNIFWAIIGIIALIKLFI